MKRVIMNKRFFTLLAVSFATLWAALAVRPALAHARVEVGPYVIIIGWANEPPVVGERNNLVLEVTRDGTPVEGVEGTLDVVVDYAGRSFTGNLNPTTTPGHYYVPFFPTVRGQYTVRLGGAIEETAVDASGEPEEILPATVIQFPESPPDVRELQETVDDLSSQLGTARLLGIGGTIAGILGIIIGVVSLMRGRNA